jgi:AhpD family alkylhydroperoxidase
MRGKDKVMALDAGAQAALEPDMQAYFDKCKEKLGFIPNVLRAYAFDNAKLIAVAVSSVNHCHYCLTAHGAAVRQRGRDPELGELIAQNYRAAALDARKKAMLDFTVKLTEAPDKIEEQDREALRGAGFSDRDIWDIAAVAAFYNMSNRLAAAADMRPNREYHYLVREPVEVEAAKPAQTGGARPAAPAPQPAAQRRRRGTR